VSKKIIYVQCLVLSFSMTAQLAKDRIPRSGSIAGKVIDDKSKQPIPYASLNVLKRKGTITFRVNDIFKSMKFKFKSANLYPQNGQFNWESRTAYLGFMYRFGIGKNKRRSRKNRKDNETQGSGFI